MRSLDGAARRVVLSHAVAALSLSLPWPLLLVLVAEQGADPLQLGLAGAARMLPYVVCSWAAGRLADRVRRDLIVRLTLLLRGALMVLAALAVVSDHVWAAVAASTLAVAVSTPAYPALVAAMPGVAGRASRRATDLLVTVEVAAFVVGAALGGLLLAPATRVVVPWLPVALVVVAAVLIAPVRMPRPVRSRTAERASAYASLRGAPAARRAIEVMAAVNFVDGLVALALLPLALDRWGSDERGFGLATGVLGFAALGAPLLTRLGRTPARATRHGLALVAVSVVAVVPAQRVGWALVPLAVLGAASVAVESSATGLLQDELPDEVRATVLGITDTAIVGAAMIGSLVAPVAVTHLGGPATLLGLASGVLLLAWWATPTASHAPATVVETRGEPHAPVTAPTTAAPWTALVRVPAPRRPDDVGPGADGVRGLRQTLGYAAGRGILGRRGYESVVLRVRDVDHTPALRRDR